MNSKALIDQLSMDDGDISLRTNTQQEIQEQAKQYQQNLDVPLKLFKGSQYIKQRLEKHVQWQDKINKDVEDLKHFSDEAQQNCSAYFANDRTSDVSLSVLKDTS